MNAELALLLRGIDEAFDRKSWHGTNLRGSLRGVSAAEAGWRVAPGRHSIQEIVLHCAYWKYAARRRILGEKRGKFPLKGSNWFNRTGGTDQLAWREVVRLLDSEHAHLHQAVAGLRGRRPDGRLPGSSVTLEHLLRGIAAHDLYHAGQIQLLKRLRRTRRA